MQAGLSFQKDFHFPRLILTGLGEDYASAYVVIIVVRYIVFEQNMLNPAIVADNISEFC